MAFEASISWDAGEGGCQTDHGRPSHLWGSPLLLLVRLDQTLDDSMHGGLSSRRENPLRSFLCLFSTA